MNRKSLYPVINFQGRELEAITEAQAKALGLKMIAASSNYNISDMLNPEKYQNPEKIKYCTGTETGEEVWIRIYAEPVEEKKQLKPRIEPVEGNKQTKTQ